VCDLLQLLAPLDLPDVLLDKSCQLSCIRPASRLRTKGSPVTCSTFCLSDAELSGIPVHQPRYLSTLAIGIANPRLSLWTNTLGRPPSPWLSSERYSGVRASLHRATDGCRGRKLLTLIPQSKTRFRIRQSFYLDLRKTQTRSSSALR
jgi:hypothetical protein